MREGKIPQSPRSCGYLTLVLDHNIRILALRAWLRRDAQSHYWELFKKTGKAQAIAAIIRGICNGPIPSHKAANGRPFEALQMTQFPAPMSKADNEDLTYLVALAGG